LYIGQTTEGYMIVESGSKLRIVDPHALHERMIYEKLKRREGRGELLRMLFPVVVSLSARERAYKDLLVQVMRDVGFEVDDFGPNDVAVSAVPTVFEGGDPGGVAKDVLDALSAGGESGGKDVAAGLREKAFASAACHAAVKLGKRFREDEAVAFLKDASRVAMVQVCPHGRPTSVDIDLNSIKGRLSR
jgi:DNA mismatch repair protein MutL